MDTATIEKEAQVFEKQDDRSLIKKEAAADPRFARVVAAMLRENDGERKVADFAKRAIMNELNPKEYPETSGYWKLLREAARRATDALPAAIVKTVAKMTPEQRAADLKAVREGRLVTFNPSMLGELGELGQFEIIGSLVGSLAQAGASIYGSYLTNRTQQQISAMQFDAQKAQLQAQMDMARAQQAITAAQAQQAAEASILPTAIAQPVQAVASALSTDVGGLPLWLIALGVAFALKFGKWA